MIPLHAAVLIAALASSSAAGDSTTRAPFAVVELFTSEGCSSCPPADRLLSSIDVDAQRDRRNVMTLEFHVDYWNSPAWMDSFSDAASSERQRVYGKALGSELYTPQAVVNGRRACVGSDAGTLRRAIDDELARVPRASIALTKRTAAGVFEIGYHVTGAPRGALVCAALTESGLSTSVRGGENAGRELAHGAVVRAFVIAPLETQGAGMVRFHDNGGFGHPRRAVVLIQDPMSFEVLVAASIAL